MAPTRELALQVQRELTWLYAAAGARVVSCVGGMDIRKEQRALAFGDESTDPALRTLIGKVATSPAQVTDADFAAAKAAGYSEDQLFELVVAAYVSKVNGSAFCIAAHTATASQAYHDMPRVAAVLADLDSAPVAEPLRATLRMLGTLTATEELSAADVREVLAAGVSPEQVEDALAVCAAFNTTNRLADAFGFEMLSPEDFQAGAKFLLKRGYG